MHAVIREVDSICGYSIQESERLLGPVNTWIEWLGSGAVLDADLT